MLPKVESFAPVGISWFTGGGAVVRRGSVVEVTVRGVLVGLFAEGDIGARNAVLVGLAAGPTMHLGQLAAAFGITDERLRQIRRLVERKGLMAVVQEPKRSRSKIDEVTWARLAEMFDDGLTIAEAHRRISRRLKVSPATVGVIRQEWAERRRQASSSTSGQPISEDTSPAATPPSSDAKPAQLCLLAASAPTASADAPSPSSLPTRPIEPAPRERAIVGGFLQHAGTWLLMATLARYGLYDELNAVAAMKGPRSGPLRTAADAFVAALAIGEHTVEGVRRLATSSGPNLLRASSMPSPDHVRRVLADLAHVGGDAFHERMARRLLARAANDDGPTVFYVDNHLRPYTGNKVVRRGWRMQDRRVRPGTTDLYIHDEDGRPILRFPSSSHEGLTTWLPKVAGWLRAALGEDRRILLAFDRAGAFPDTISTLRNESFELVTYERRPYRMLVEREFEHEVTFTDGGEPEVVRYRAQHVGMGRGRGDVRRIVMRMPDGRQVNLLAISSLKPPRLMEIMRGRWVQENAFKHGVERWGVNQLDGRRTEPVAPDTVVPNPARRRLDDALRIVSVRMGLVRNELAELPLDSPKRAALEAEVVQCQARRSELLDDRGYTPKRAPLAQTELAGKLVAHIPLYKTTLDTIRIVCANAEADLATRLASHLSHPREAKKLLAALFVAPAHVSIGKDGLRVVLAPAADRAERIAVAAFLRAVTADRLVLPGDASGRVISFEAKW